MKKLATLIAFAIALVSVSYVSIAKEAEEAKPENQKSHQLGVLAAEDFADADDYEAAKLELDGIIVRNYQFIDGHSVLTSKKKISLYDISTEEGDFTVIYGEELLGNIADQAKTQEVLEAKKQKQVKQVSEEEPSKDQLQDSVYELYAADAKDAPARCYAADTRVMYPPYTVYNWNQCVRWARSTRLCRNVEMPEHYPPLSTDGCKCFY